MLRLTGGREREGEKRESIYFRMAVKRNVVSVHTEKEYGRSIGIVLLVLKLASF
jgi:hypothetical protein